jgi:hypothetical protein
MVYVCGSARALTITESYNRPLAASPGVMMVLSPRKIVSWLCITWNDDGTITQENCVLALHHLE